MVAWNSRRFHENQYVLFLGVAYLFVGGLDLLHTLAYKGMGVFVGYGPDLATQLWIAARAIEAGSLLAAPIVFHRGLKPRSLLLGQAVVASLLLGSIFYWEVFPVCFVEGVGLTAFKKVSEYLICLALLGAVALLARKRKEFDRDVFALLVASILVTVCSELAFTLYKDVYGPANLIGHLLKIVSFYLIYKALIEMALTRPYNLLFRELTEREREVQASGDFLQTVLDAIPEPTIVIGRDYRIALANRAAREAAGGRDLAADRLTCHHTMHDSDTPCDGTDRPCLLREVVATKAPATVTHAHSDANGEQVMVEVSAAPIFDEAGEVRQVVESCRDVTERKRAEEKIAGLVRFPDENPNPLLRVWADGTILYANDASLPLRTAWACGVGDRLADPWRGQVRDAIGSGRCRQAEVECAGRLFSLTFAPITEAGYVNVYGLDITDGRSAEDALASYRDHLQELVKKRTDELASANEQL